MKTLQFRLAARTDAAGKYNPEAPLEGNEDNMFVDSFLEDAKKGAFLGDEVVDLSEKGCLMVVADGMGGMNAGEVASDIAIKTVMEYFSPEKVTKDLCSDSKARIKYMEDVVTAADKAIKTDSKTNREHEGMGSTIILAWLCDGEMCLTWCGDSRAYLFRPGKGLRQVSKDHSYVQELMDQGKITENEAFDHPYGNIVTRSLGDPEKKAVPDSLSFKVYEGDVFMLCSDGLSGVLRDHKTFVDGQRVDTENLEDIISENRHSMVDCRDRLFEAAYRNEWYDNVTAILCEIVQGEPAPEENEDVEPTQNEIPTLETNETNVLTHKRPKPKFFLLALAALLLVIGVLLWWKCFRVDGGQNSPETETVTDPTPPCTTDQEVLPLESVEDPVKEEDQVKEDAAEETSPSAQKPSVTPKKPKLPTTAPKETDDLTIVPNDPEPTVLTKSPRSNNENQ